MRTLTGCLFCLLLLPVADVSASDVTVYDNPADVVRVTLVNTMARNYGAVIDVAFVLTNCPG